MNERLASDTRASQTTAGVAGWLKAGMLDWEGHLTTTVFVSGCNLRCPYCHNPDLLVPGKGVDTAPLIAHLHEKRDWLDGVVITGGEPTLDPGLFALLDEIAALCLPVKLDTNGTRPHALQQLLESGLVAAVSMDIKTTPERYSEVSAGDDVWPAVEESMHVLRGSGVPHELRTTAYPGLVAPDDLPAIACTIAGGDHYTIQQFRPRRTYDRCAGQTHPYDADVLHDIAQKCSAFIDTTVRGA